MQTKYCAGRKLQLRHSIGRASDVDYSTFDGRTSDAEYSTFDGRPIESIKSDPKKGASNVECSTSEEGCFGCRIFDIRRTANRMYIIVVVYSNSTARYSCLAALIWNKFDFQSTNFMSYLANFCPATFVRGWAGMGITPQCFHSILTSVSDI